MLSDVSQQIIPFSDEWWSQFKKDSSNMTIPITVKDAFTDHVDELKGCIYEMLQNLKSDEEGLAWRVWKDGKLDSTLKDQIINDPIQSENDLLAWQERHFKNNKFGIILNNGQRYSDNAKRIISNFFDPFLKNNAPLGGINFSIFIGNYGWTPIGIHEDHTGSFVMHFHLGPNDKTMHMWERSNYKEILEGKDNDINPEKYIPFADYTCNFNQGDIFFMPWNYYHIGESHDLSLGITVWFNYTTSDGLLNGIWESGLNELTDSDISDNSEALYIKDINDENPINNLLNQLNDDILETSLEEFIINELNDYISAIKSNDWYDNGAIKHKKDNVNLQNDTLLIINKSKIHLKQLDGTVKFFHRGDKVSFHHHNDMKELINRINEGTAKSIHQLISGLFNDWPEGIGIRILEILCENDILKIYKS